MVILAMVCSGLPSELGLMDRWLVTAYWTPSNFRFWLGGGPWALGPRPSTPGRSTRRAVWSIFGYTSSLPFPPNNKAIGISHIFVDLPLLFISLVHHCPSHGVCDDEADRQWHDLLNEWKRI